VAFGKFPPPPINRTGNPSLGTSHNCPFSFIPSVIRGRVIIAMIRNITVCYVRPCARIIWATTRPIFMTFDIWVFLENLSWRVTRITGTSHEDQYTWFIIYIIQFFLDLEMFQTKVVEIHETRILRVCSITFSRKSCRLWDIVEKYVTAWQTSPQYNTTHACCMFGWLRL